MEGDSPNVQYGPIQTDYRRLLYSDESILMTVPIQLAAGYGILHAGTALAKNNSAAGNKGKFIPYSPSDITGAEDAPVRAYLVSDSGTSADDLYVTIQDSYKFIVGDDLMIIDDTTSGENLGAITAIDRTSFTNMAKITVTTATGGTSFTVARHAFVAAEGYDTCVGILGKSVDTGIGSKAVGAGASLFLKNYIVYTAGLRNVDAAAVADLSLSTIGLYTYK